MVEYEPDQITQPSVVLLISNSHRQSSAFEKPLPTRHITLPIVFNHPSIHAAELRYQTLQRDQAVYVPDNVSYVADNNGLPSRTAVFDVLRQTKFLVVAVGFMTGLPLLWPLNPAARLTSQKYNPTRIATPPGTVGLGGGLFCVYPTEQPGGYMMLARSVPVWDTYALRPGFRARGTPWLCEPFDIVEFAEVTLDEYADACRRFDAGTYDIAVRQTTFDVRAELERERLGSEMPEAVEFRAKQAVAAERTRLREEGLYAEWQRRVEKDRPSAPVSVEDKPGVKVASPQIGKVWKVLVEKGERVGKGKALVVLEAMKLEIEVLAEEAHDGLVVEEVLVQEGTLVSPGTSLVLLGNPT